MICKYIFEGRHRSEFLKYDVFLDLTFLTSAKSVDTDEMPLSVLEWLFQLKVYTSLNIV